MAAPSFLDRTPTGLTSRQLDIVKYLLDARKVSTRPHNMSSSETRAAIAMFAHLWLTSSKTARELAKDFIGTVALSATTSLVHGGHDPARAATCGINGCDVSKPPTALGLHRKKMHGVEGLTLRRRKLPGIGHQIRVTRHASDRLQELFGLHDSIEASDIADVLWLEARSGTAYPGRDGASFYEHPDALLLVGKGNQQVPELISVMPPSWTLLKDVQGKEHYWAVGPEERRKGDLATQI